MLRGLRTLILFWTILPLAVVLIGIASLGVNSHQTAMRELIAERDGALARVSANQITELIQERERALEYLDPARPETWNTLLFDGGVALFDAQNNLLSAVPGREIWSSRITPLPSGGSFSRPFLENGVWRVLVVRRADQKLLVGAFSLPAFNSFSPRGIVYLVDSAGRIIAHPDVTQVGVDLRQHEGIAEVVRGEAGATFHHDVAGTELVVGYAPIQATGWGLLIDEPWANVIAPMFQYAVLLPLMLLLVAIVALGAVYFGVRNVIRPLDDLAHVANRIAFGDYQAAAKSVGGVGEIEELRKTLDSMAHQVEAAQQAMQNYIAAVTRTQEDERKRLARELHDDTIQTLIALRQRVEMAQTALAKDPAQAISRLDQLKELLSESLDSVRRFVRDLRPTYLEELGLIPALEMLAREANAKFTIKGDEQRLGSEEELAFFRIVQEALSNARKHAHAKNISLTLSFDGEGTTATIEDDGEGFDPPDTPTAYARAGHFGLMGMQERAQLFGGNVYIKSGRGKGTKVVAFVPKKN